MTAFRMVEWVYCLSNIMVFSRNNDSMSQVSGQVTVLVVLGIMLKQSFAFSPVSYWGIKVYGKINRFRTQNLEFSMQDPLSCPPDTILCICDSLFSLFLLPYISNLHTPSLEHTNPPWRGVWQKSPQKGDSRHMAAQCGTALSQQ